MEGVALMDSYYAFDYLGVCHPLGNCGDIIVANEIADDLHGEDWAFVYTAKEIIDLAEIVKNRSEQ
jgi:hypothetical protein